MTATRETTTGPKLRRARSIQPGDVVLLADGPYVVAEMRRLPHRLEVKLSFVDGVALTYHENTRLRVMA